MEARSILPLILMFTNFSRGHPGILDAAVHCTYRFDGHPTLYIASNTIVGLLPFCHEEPFTVFHHSLHLHSKEDSHKDDKNVEVVALPEVILQVLPLFLLFHCLEALIQWLILVIEGVIIHNMHAMNNVHPSMPEFTDYNIPFLIGPLLRCQCNFGWSIYWMGLSLPHCTTWIDEGVVSHLQEGNGFPCKVGNRIMELVVIGSNEATIITILDLVYGECHIASFTVGREVWEVYVIA